MNLHIKLQKIFIISRILSIYTSAWISELDEKEKNSIPKLGKIRIIKKTIEFLTSENFHIKSDLHKFKYKRWYWN